MFLNSVVIVHKGLHKSTTILERHECSFFYNLQQKNVFICTNLQFIAVLALPRRLILCQCRTAVTIKVQFESECHPRRVEAQQLKQVGHV